MECAMTMWVLLLMMNLVMPVTGAVSAAHDLQTGWTGYFVAIVIGVLPGATSVWMLKTMLSRVIRSTPPDDMRTTWQIRLLYWVAIAWPVVTLLGCDWLVRAVLATL